MGWLNDPTTSGARYDGGRRLPAPAGPFLASDLALPKSESFAAELDSELAPAAPPVSTPPGDSIEGFTTPDVRLGRCPCWGVEIPG